MREVGDGEEEIVLLGVASVGEDRVVGDEFQLVGHGLDIVGIAVAGVDEEG